MTKKQVLSVIIPAFNEENTIREILQRVLAIDLHDIDKEILVIDDYSSDNTRQLVENFIEEERENNLKLFKHDKTSIKW